MANICYVRQNHPKELGHTIFKVKSFVVDETFVTALGDDIVYNDIPVVKQLIDNYSKYSSCIVGYQEVKEADVSKYGIVKPSKSLDKKIVEMEKFIEKPSIEEAPLKLACLGRYLLTPKDI